MSTAKPSSRESVRLFGTDGIRGPAGAEPLDPASLLRLGRALGKVLNRGSGGRRVLLAGDTRESTPEICRWLTLGLRASDCETTYGGVLPTPAISRLTCSGGYSVGVAVSASHNPFPDNGVKLLDSAGFKWSREQEIEVERAFALEEPAAGDAAGALSELEPAAGLETRYLDELCAFFPHSPLAGLAIVLDAANGAASRLGAEFFTRLGADVVAIHDHPTGSNINLDCGSTHPESAIARTLEQGADLGFAFDGDADRALAIDGTGVLHDGDAMLYVLANWFMDNGKLDPPRLVATSMSNLGLERALGLRGIGTVRCDVGDRAVVETLKAEGLELGGEQAGHIVHLGLSATGDGLLLAAMIARAVASSGQPLSVLTEGFQRFPQVLRNVRVASKPDLRALPGVSREVSRVEDVLGSDGRLVLRYSGTEPLARVMIEGPDQAEIEDLAEGLALKIQSEISALGPGA